MEYYEIEAVLNQWANNDADVLARAVANWEPEDQEKLDELLIAVEPTLEEVSF